MAEGRAQLWQRASLAGARIQEGFSTVSFKSRALPGLRARVARRSRAGRARIARWSCASCARVARGSSAVRADVRTRTLTNRRGSRGRRTKKEKKGEDDAAAAAGPSPLARPWTGCRCSEAFRPLTLMRKQAAHMYLERKANQKSQAMENCRRVRGHTDTKIPMHAFGNHGRNHARHRRRYRCNRGPYPSSFFL